ncbi:rhomboid family intramembrane serine protease [Bacillus sp. H-16]|uniref:rhomboid family intramembrane serine protease n=1 Tax=Alteribacter salitolerans TaxID=2912333 RepID=UPI001965A0D2|nr:rhomboid family intramembrane serine protease [Alteribacter salitolerans]MBM7096808.1 rhomboid family intramembrane serine protease [Alteribacter salitolerans]
MFIRNESFESYTRSYPIVTTLIAIHFVLFLWINFLPGLGGFFIYQRGVGYNLAVMMGEYWRLITPVFLHVSLMHVAFNSFSLFLFGPALEQMLGKFKFIVAYLLTGFLANIATLMIGGVDYPPHLGASGAIYGLFGIYLYMVLQRKDLIDSGNAQLVVTILFIGLIMTFLNPQINIYAHIFGLIAGAALGPLILHRVSPFNPWAAAAARSRPDDNDIGFDPDRWNKKARSKKRTQEVLFAVLVVLVLIGILSRFI